MSDSLNRQSQAPDERAFRLLIEAYLDGNVSQTQLEDLERNLASNPEHRRVFVAVCLQDQIIGRLVNRAGAVVSDSDSCDDEIADPHREALATLVDDALRARRLTEVKQQAQHELEDSRRFEISLAQRKELALREKNAGGDFSLPPWALIGGLAAAMFLVLWLAGSFSKTDTPPPSYTYQQQPPSPNQAGAVEFVAVISSSVDAVWHDPSTNAGPIRMGEEITLDQGVVELVFDGGATVIIEGPVTFVPTSPNGLRLLDGQISASAPLGSGGFRVNTADMVVSNVVADFGVTVDQYSGSRASAFSGEITVDTRSIFGSQFGDVSQVVPGTTALAQASGLQIVHTDTSSQFIHRPEYEARVLAVDGDAYSRWLAYSFKLRRDPDVIAYYTFERHEASLRTLFNNASHTTGRMNGVLGDGDDSMTVPRWVEGRFPEKDALQFGGLSPSRAKRVVIEDFGGIDLGSTLTLAVWVKTPASRVDAGGGTLLSLRDGSPRRHMSFQLSLFLEGDPYPECLQFGAGNELDVEQINDSFHYSGQQVVSPDQWHLVAIVYDNASLSYYIDGSLVGSAQSVGRLETTRDDTPLFIGIDPRHPLSHDNAGSLHEAFMGAIDEIVILRRAMRAEEIHEMYQIGRSDQF